MNIFVRVGSSVARNAHKILFGTSVILAVSVPVVAAKNAADATNHIYDEELDRGERLSTKDKIKESWKYYIPTIGLTAAELLSIYGMHEVNQKRYAAILGSYLASKEFYDNYQEKVKETIGEEKEKDIRESLKNVKASTDDKFKVYEPFSNQFFTVSKEQLLWAELTLNKMFHEHGWVTLNQFLELIPGTKCRKDCDKIGWGVGMDSWDYNWSFYGTPWIDVRPQIGNDDNGDPIMVLRFGMPPAEPDFDNPDEQIPFDIRFKGGC